jgi:hypothetical protein
MNEIPELIDLGAASVETKEPPGSNNYDGMNGDFVG